MNTTRDIEFLFEMGAFRFVERTWRQFLNADFANDAEHTFRVCWIALTLAKYEGVTNTGKVLKMALLHDIAESRTGDVNYLSRQYTERNEDLAIADMLEDTALNEAFTELWREYEARETIEAKIVKDADNLDVDFELAEQARNGISLAADWDATRSEVGNRLYTESARRLRERIYASNPHDWHMKGRNRLTSGDWRPASA